MTQHVFRMKRLCAAMAAFAALALAAPAAQAESSAAAALTDVRIQLIDLDLADGITPDITFGFGASTTGWLQVMTNVSGVMLNNHVDVPPGTAHGPLAVANGSTFATGSMLAGDLFGSTGPGASVTGGAWGTSAMGWGLGQVLPADFRLTANTRLVMTASVATSAQATLGDSAIAYGLLAGSDPAGNYFAISYAQSRVNANGSAFIDPTTALQISFDNGANEYSGYLYTTVSAYTDSVTVIPEPQSAALMLAGLALLGGVARRRTRER